VNGKTVEVVTDGGGGDCGYAFRQGESSERHGDYR